MKKVVPTRVVINEEGSMLREWEEMHRPPAIGQPILLSGPMAGRMSRCRERRRVSLVTGRKRNGTWGQGEKRQGDWWTGREVLWGDLTIVKLS